MSIDTKINQIPKNLISILKGLNNKFRLLIVEQLLNTTPLSLSKLQKALQKPNGYLLNHIHRLEYAGIIQNFINHDQNSTSREYSFYELTDLGKIIYLNIKKLLETTFGKKVIEKNSVTVFKAIDNPIRWVIFDIISEKQRISFSELKNLTNECNPALINHLHKLEIGGLIQNYYQKTENQNEYSFYEITQFGSTLIDEITRCFNLHYEVKSKNPQVSKHNSNENKKFEIAFHPQD